MSHRRSAARASALLALAALSHGACNNSEKAGPRPSVTAPGETAAPSPPSTTTDPGRTIDITFSGGQVAGGPRRETVRLGEKVRLRVASDVADEVHVHTYDLRADVVPKEVTEVEVTAAIPGRHEVELERSSKLLLTLEVR